MNKHQAISAMMQGKQVKNTSFLQGEPLCMHGDFRVYKIGGEYGQHISQDDFPDSGWEVVENGANIVFDTLYREIFSFSRADKNIAERLRLASEEEKKKLLESGKDSVYVGLSEEEIKNLGWNPREKFALANVETKEMFLTSDAEELCQDAFRKMTSKHPLSSKMQLVKNPSN